MNIYLYICLQYTAYHQSLDVTVESVPYDVTVYASITVKRNVVSVTLYTSGIVGEWEVQIRTYVYITVCKVPITNRRVSPLTRLGAHGHVQ